MATPLAFAEAGIPIFPVRLRRDGERWRKIPCIKQWQHRASADLRLVEGWWRQWPDAVPGIALARTRWVVVDCDRHGGPDGVAEFAKLGPHPPHPIVISPLSNGEHHFFQQPDTPITSSDAFKHLGIDILGTSRFVVGYDLAPLLAVKAPELTAVFRAKPRSAIKRETPRVVVLPNRTTGPVVSRNSREGRYARAALHNAFDKLSSWPRMNTPEGCRYQLGRNNMLNKLAFKMGGLVANGWIDEALVIRVLMLGAAECGLLREDGEEQCLATIRSGLSAGMQLPYPQLEPRDMTIRTTQTLGVSYQAQELS
jgi:Bifunctional DNA primase/polymerase, N-terminal